MTAFYIGGTGQPEVAAYECDSWNALIAAMDVGDQAEIIRLTTTTKPKMMPTASLRTLPRASESDELPEFAREFWRKYREREGAPSPVRREGVQIDVAPNRSNERTNEILRRIAEGGGQS